MRDTESYKNSGAIPTEGEVPMGTPEEHTEGEVPTGSLIDVNPESFGYTFSGFDEMRKQSGMMNPLRAWTNKHGLSLGNVAKLVYKFNQEYAEKKGWQLATSSSPPHRIKADAVADNKFDMYVQNYWDDIMNIEKHTSNNNTNKNNHVSKCQSKIRSRSRRKRKSKSKSKRMCKSKSKSNA